MDELSEVMDRYKIGVENIRRADGELNSQKEKLNKYIMVNFNGISKKIKRVLGNEKGRIQKAIEEFDKPVMKKKKKEVVKVDMFKPKVSRVDLLFIENGVYD